MKYMRFTLPLLVGLSLSCQKHPLQQIVGGGEPKKVTKNPADTEDRVQSQDLFKKLRLSNATLFLWKQDSTELQLTDVLRGLRVYDDVEDDSYDFQKIMEKFEEMNGKKSDLEGKIKKQDPKPTEQELQILTAELQMVVRELDAVEASKNKLYSKYGGEESLINAISGNADLLNNLFKVVDQLDTSSPTFAFDNTQEGLTLAIENVSFVNGSTGSRYSTGDGNIQKLEFKSKGAVLNFDVMSEPNVIFEFRLRRVSYEDRGGRVIFKGDMIRKILDANGNVIEKRAGQAKINTNYSK